MTTYDARVIESRWAEAWDRDRCYRAPDFPDGPKFYNYDSGPFTNGSLHMGHVRTHLLGDVTARYQRALGKSVLYCTEWDAFGLPNEAEATRRGRSPAQAVERWIDKIQRQMRMLGISHDTSRIRTTCDPRYYRWTQWLFLRLWAKGLIERRQAAVPACPRCDTVFAQAQIDGEVCARCGSTLEVRRSRQWFVLSSRFTATLLDDLDRLTRWSAPIRNLVRGMVNARGGRTVRGDWVVSRQRSWGTPIPVVLCDSCGPQPVSMEALPVTLPPDLDWTRGSAALKHHRMFVNTTCPGCSAQAQRETDTLDCFFDDIWCFVSPLVDLEQTPDFDAPTVSAWMPVDRFHSGFDTHAYLHLHRLLARVLRQSGDWKIDEPIVAHEGHEMVLARGRKMSKHLGNAVSPTGIVRKYGADALRVAILWAARPHSSIEWDPRLLERPLRFLNELYEVVDEFVRLPPGSDGGDFAGPSRGMISLCDAVDRALIEIGRFIDEYRPNAAIEHLVAVWRRTAGWARQRLGGSRLSGPDGLVLERLFADLSIALSPFAPHLAEELWHRLGRHGYVVEQRWPGRKIAYDTSVRGEPVEVET